MILGYSKVRAQGNILQCTVALPGYCILWYTGCNIFIRPKKHTGTAVPPHSYFNFL